MSEFIFDKEIFKKKFIAGNAFRNRAKNVASGCSSVCPNNSDDKNQYKGYTSKELLSDTIHFLRGEVLTDKKIDNLEETLKSEIIKQVSFDNDELKGVFRDIINSFYFEKNDTADRDSISLLRYQKASHAKDFGKFVVDVFFDDVTKDKFIGIFDSDMNPLDNIVNNSYVGLQILKSLKPDKEYSRIFSAELSDLFNIMNKDFQEALSSRNDATEDMELLLTYYLFVYLSQVSLRLDNDLEGKSTENIVYFKAAKEPVSEDRDCVVQGWKKVERKTSKIFKHLIVLNMLNCHDNATSYDTYSELYAKYNSDVSLRMSMDDAVDYIIDQYTNEYKHDTETPGVYVDFNLIPLPGVELSAEERFKRKIQYLYNCVSLQLDSKVYRQNVTDYVAGNYNHILKMRFVKSWGQLGHMMIISNEDLIRMIKVCQRSSSRMNKDRGIQISDLFEEFAHRYLYFDGKTKQYIIDYLVEINLIDSKCDSEEAQYVKRIQ